MIATVLLKLKNFLALFCIFPSLTVQPTDIASSIPLRPFCWHLSRRVHVLSFSLLLQPFQLSEGSLQAAIVQGLVAEDTIELWRWRQCIPSCANSVARFLWC